MSDETTSTTPGTRALAPARGRTTPTSERRVPGRGSSSRPALLGALPELALAAVAAGLFLLARNFQYEPQPGQLGPGFWPQLLCAGILVCAVARVAQKLHVRAGPVAGSARAEEEEAHFRWRRLAVAVALVVGYVFGTVFLGYILATTLFFAAFVWLGGQRRWYVAPLGLGVSLLFAFVFLKVVYVSLPSGVGIFDQFSVLVYRLIGVY